MEPAKLLKAKFSTLEFLQTKIANNNAEQADGWKSNLVALRRQMQDILSTLREALAAWEASDGDQQISADLSKELSKLRTAMADHQANWPAVAINVDDAGYQRSIHNLRSATDDFWAAAKRLLLHLN